jgi:hypothetical protein
MRPPTKVSSTSTVSPPVAQLVGGFVLHCEPDAVKHEPCRLLCHLEIASNLVAADTVLAVGDEPHCGKPLVETYCRIFHDGSDLDRELTLRMVAGTLPSAALLAEFHAVGTTRRAYDLAAWPAAKRQVVNTVVGIREVDDCFLKALWFARGFHSHKRNYRLN